MNTLFTAETIFYYFQQYFDKLIDIEGLQNNIITLLAECHDTEQKNMLLKLEAQIDSIRFKFSDNEQRDEVKELFENFKVQKTGPNKKGLGK